MKVSPQIQKLVPYKAGKPISEVKRELKLDVVYKLASNENAIGYSPKVKQAILAAMEEMNRYPDASYFQLRQKFSQFYKVDANQLVFGCGSNELIDLLIRVYCEPGDAILTSEQAFIAYKICAQAARIDFTETKMGPNLKINVQEIIRAYRPEHKLIFLPNPNNPTGTYLNKTELCFLLDFFKNNEDVLIVMDEAYVEFARAPDYQNALDLMKEYPNLVVLRTMSKAYGLAGLRLGVMIAPAQVCEYVNRIRMPFNISNLTEAAAMAAIDDLSFVEQSKKACWAALDYYYAELKKLGLKYIESQANFVLFDTQGNGDAIAKELLKHGVIFRPVNNYALPSYLRLSVGLPHENELAMLALNKVLKTSV